MIIICYDDPRITNIDSSQQYTKCRNLEEFRVLYPHAAIRYIFDEQQDLYKRYYGDQAEFAAVCEAYGFYTNDYRKIFKNNAQEEFRLIKINTKNRKYKCIIENIHTHKILKTTPEYVKYWMSKTN